MWNGTRVLSAEWVADATARQVSTGNDDGNWNHGYGYQLWRSRVGYRADGSLGQFSFVLPDQDVVLAITSGTNDTDGVMNRVWDNLLPAIAFDAQPENPTALAALRDRLAGLALPTHRGARGWDGRDLSLGRRHADRVDRRDRALDRRRPGAVRGADEIVPGVVREAVRSEREPREHPAG
jgi:hypothetical protein